MKSAFGKGFIVLTGQHGGCSALPRSVNSDAQSSYQRTIIPNGWCQIVESNESLE
jgi:hypothetical protein